MNLKEVLKLADELVYAKTGQHLNNLQEAVLRGTIQGETYQEMANEFCCSEGHIRDVGSKLWQILSEALGEDVHKSNCRATMERLQVSIWSENFPRESVQIGSVNFCGSTLQTSDIFNNQNVCKNCKVTPTEAGYQDLSEMPDFGTFYDRTDELATLKKWILE